MSKRKPIIKKPKLAGFTQKVTNDLNELAKNIDAISVDMYEKDLLIEELKNRLVEIGEVNDRKYHDNTIASLCDTFEAEKWAKEESSRYLIERDLRNEF